VHNSTSQNLKYDDRAKGIGVAQEAIDEYNGQLPSEKEIQEINNYSTALKRIVNNGMAFLSMLIIPVQQRQLM
jgi:hypothetical protein